MFTTAEEERFQTALLDFTVQKIIEAIEKTTADRQTVAEGNGN